MNSIRPTQKELREATQTLETSLKAFEPVLEKEEEIELDLRVSNHFSGQAWEPGRAAVDFDPRAEGWRERLRGVAAVAFAQAWFLEYRQPEMHWEEMLRIGLSIHFAERNTEWEPGLDPRQTVSEDWPSIKTGLSSPLEESRDELVGRGYSASYYIVEQLMKSTDIDEVPQRSLSDVEEAGDQALG